MARLLKFWLLALWLAACGREAEEPPPQAETEIVPGNFLNAELHFDRGVALAAQGRHTEAIEAYLQAVELAPDDLRVHYNLGNACVRKLDYPRAIEAYLQVLELDSTHVSARNNLAAMYVKQLNYAQAMVERRKVLELDPGHITNYYDLAFIHFIRGEYPEAEELIAEGQRRAPDYPSFFHLLGRIRFKQRKFDAALDNLKQAIQLDSTSAAMFTDLAKTQVKVGDFQEAAQACRRSIAMAPLDKDPYFVLVNALRRLGQQEESQRVLAEFRRLDQLQDKIEDQLRMLGNEPSDHEARAMLGLLYIRQERFSEAAESYLLATRLAPDSMRYHNNLGNLYLRLQKYERAIQTYTEALRLAPDYAEAHYNLGQAYLHTQRFEEAKRSLLQARQYRPEDADGNYFLGLLYAREGKYERAAEVFEQALKTRPDFLDARQKLAVSYLKLGRYEESKEQVEIIKERNEEETKQIDKMAH